MPYMNVYDRYLNMGRFVLILDTFQACDLFLLFSIHAPPSLYLKGLLGSDAVAWYLVFSIWCCCVSVGSSGLKGCKWHGTEGGHPMLHQVVFARLLVHTRDLNDTWNDITSSIWFHWLIPLKKPKDVCSESCGRSHWELIWFEGYESWPSREGPIIHLG